MFNKNLQKVQISKNYRGVEDGSSNAQLREIITVTYFPYNINELGVGGGGVCFQGVISH